MKGIVLAGGSGTRLYPITKGVRKQQKLGGDIHVFGYAIQFVSDMMSKC